MKGMESVLRQTIEYARERCHALAEEIEDLEQKTYPTTSPKLLLKFIKERNEIIRGNLDAIETDFDLFETLEPEELEQNVKRYCKFLPYLCNLLEYIEGSEIQTTPAALIRPLRRLVKRYLPESDIIFRSYPQLNYSFAPITQRLRKVFRGDSFPATFEGLPDFFAVVSFPKVESNYVLLHCMVGHEIGHGMYQTMDLEDVLKPTVKINKVMLDQLTKLIVEAESEKEEAPGKHYPSETEISESLRVKQLLTKLINKVIGNWVEELAADAFAICIFGPSYFFAFINFVATIRLLRSSSHTHPSPSTRIKLIWHLLKSNPKDNTDQQDDTDPLSFEKVFDRRTRGFVQQWVEAACTDGTPLHPIFDIVEKSITSEVIDRICSEVTDKMNGYKHTIQGTIQEYKKSIPILCDLIKNLIPPNEVVDFPSRTILDSEVVSILNAGWQVYLFEMDQFAANLKVKYQDEKRKCDKKLNELLLRAIELNEIKTRWNEISND